jgi:carbamoylphosphate synthase large subunit
MKKVLSVLTCALAGCATQKPVATTYWMQKHGVVYVHHVVRNKDTIDKLSEKALSDKDVAKENLPKGKYYAAVESEEVKPSATPSPHPAPKKPAKTEAANQDKIAKIERQIRSLSTRLDEQTARNKELQDQVDAQQKQPTVVSQAAGVPIESDYHAPGQ